MNDLGEKWEQAKELSGIEDKNRQLGADLSKVDRLPHSSSGSGQKQQPLSFGQIFAKSYYRHDKGGLLELEKGRAIGRKEIDIEAKDFDFVEFKTTMATTAGFAPQNIRSGRLSLTPTRPIMIPDILPTINVTTGNAYVYMLETTFTNNAAEAAEGAGPWGEAALAYTETSVPVRKIATFLPVTDEQLEDVQGMTDLIDSRLSTMVMLRLDSQLINGDGIAPNINGFNNQVTQTQAKGTDPVFDAVYKGMIQVMSVGYANPTAFVVHPLDWQDIRLTRTTEGIYLLGNPADAGPERIFGIPAIITTAATTNTGLVGDFTAHSGLAYRSGIEFKVSDSHVDYFVKGIQAVRATIRAALVVFRLSAFSKITGI